MSWLTYKGLCVLSRSGYTRNNCNELTPLSCVIDIFGMPCLIMQEFIDITEKYQPDYIERQFSSLEGLHEFSIRSSVGSAYLILVWCVNHNLCNTFENQAKSTSGCGAQIRCKFNSDLIA